MGSAQSAEQQLNKCLACQTESFELPSCCCSTLQQAANFPPESRNYPDLLQGAQYSIQFSYIFYSIHLNDCVSFSFFFQKVTASFSPNCLKLNVFATSKEKVRQQLCVCVYMCVFTCLWVFRFVCLWIFTCLINPYRFCMLGIRLSPMY